MQQASIFLLALGVGVAAMTMLWGVSLARRDASIVDLWWAPGFAVVSALAWALSGAPLDALHLLTLAIVVGWSARMTQLFLRRRKAHPGEDPRYTDLRTAWGRGFWWKSLFIVFLLQSVLQWIVALAPLAVITAAPAAIGPLAAVGAIVALAGLALETRADAELDAHKSGPDSAAVCGSGLRAIVRYPNYVGEILVWTGLWLMAVEAGAWWTLVSPILIGFLLVRVSGAPILDERLAARPGGRRWLETTPAFVPRRLQRLFGRRTGSSRSASSQ